MEVIMNGLKVAHGIDFLLSFLHPAFMYYLAYTKNTMQEGLTG